MKRKIKHSLKAQAIKDGSLKFVDLSEESQESARQTLDFTDPTAEGDDTWMEETNYWIEDYCNLNGYTFTCDGHSVIQSKAIQKENKKRAQPPTQKKTPMENALFMIKAPVGSEEFEVGDSHIEYDIQVHHFREDGGYDLEVEFQPVSMYLCLDGGAFLLKLEGDMLEHYYDVIHEELNGWNS